jgi:nucleotide-binding universal stress UspA family protein
MDVRTNGSGETARGVLVGYDGSVAADRAVDWAAVEATRRGVPLTVVTAVDRGGMLGTDVADLAASAPGFARDRLDALAAIPERGVQRARTVAEGLAVSPLTVTGGAAAMLVVLSSSAELLVVGNRGHGELASDLLGSVAFTVTAHAHCPVAVVVGARTAGSDAGGPVLCAVDGSPASLAALRYAADVASSSSAALTILTCWSRPSSEVWASAYGGEYADGGIDAATGRRAVEIVRSAEADAREWHPELEIRAETTEGAPARAVPAVAAGHSLVVVGSRGRGGFTGLLLGSVSHAVIRGAVCPVVVVRPALIAAGGVPPVPATAARQPVGSAT